MKIDLHTHTKYSDGAYDVEELLAYADELQIGAIAITDHDTVKAFETLDDMAYKYSVKVIKGIELTTVYKNETIHLICLFKNNVVPQKIADYCFEQRRMRNIRATEMLNKAKLEFGWEYDLDSLYSGTDVVNKHVVFKHLADMNNLPYDTIKENLSTGSYTTLKKLSLEEGIELAKTTESFCILAHPCLIKNQSILEDLLKYDIDGLECRYANPKNDVRYYTDIARQRGLFVSAGSDFHGDKKHGGLGDCFLRYDEFRAISDALNLFIS